MNVIRSAVISMVTTLKPLHKEYNNDSNSNSNSGFDVISKFVKNHDINSQTEIITKNSELESQKYVLMIRYLIIHVPHLK